MKKIYEDYARYNLWANEKWITYLSQFSSHIFEREVVNSYPSIRLTTLHLWDAELIWLGRLQGNIITKFPSETFDGTNTEIFEGWKKTSQEFLDLIIASDDHFFEESHEIKGTIGEVYQQKSWQMMHHCFNHASYHRGQLTTLVRQIGIQNGIPKTDYVHYLLTK